MLPQCDCIKLPDHLFQSNNLQHFYLLSPQHYCQETGLWYSAIILFALLSRNGSLVFSNNFVDCFQHALEPLLPVSRLSTAAARRSPRAPSTLSSVTPCPRVPSVLQHMPAERSPIACGRVGGRLQQLLMHLADGNGELCCCVDNAPLTWAKRDPPWAV